MTNMEKKRAEVREMIENGLLKVIEKGVESYGNRGKMWCQSQQRRTEYAVDTLCQWIEDEDGDIAIDRLVNLIIY